MSFSRRSLLAAPALLALPARAQSLPAVAQDDAAAPGWRRTTLIRWGDRVTFDAPPFDPRMLDAEAASAQFGWDARIAALVLPPRAADGVPRAVLAVAHPTVNAAMAFPGGRDRPEAAAEMQGASLVNLELQGGRWIIVDGGFQARRLAAHTLCRAAGPLAEELGGALRGVLAVSGGAATPWGTLLLTEGDPAPWAGRLPGFGRGQGFGWLVELDPLDPQSIPVKQTALGRYPKADAAATLARDGRAVVFLAEQGQAGYLFRFVAARPETGQVLGAGALSVAQRQDGRLVWLPLPDGAAGNAPEAARAANATPFAGPQGLSWDGRGNRLLFCGEFGALSLSPEGGDAGGPSMGVLALPVQALGRIGAIAADARGRVLLGTLGEGRVGARAQALLALEGGAFSTLYAAPRAADLGGVAVSPDGGTLFAGVRRPGAEQGASFERPATRWPEFTPGQPPRSAIVSLVRG
ncbi:alkaline phosphatase PhoX [Rubritepida flocculans]|uniref:alkaline phosphatase PhoX n=1 Tax=Rubritepida flocculans TaxID=182403 RepID=UPI00041CFC72|nr:alkaline phosphatase PhoX [Rubritepida flocculans]